MEAPLSNRQAGKAANGRLCAALLFLVVAGVYMPALSHGFITYDDPVYVTGNAHVAGGLTWENIRWAFRSTEASNWHPLTWISHMADSQAFGLHPWGHHLTNVLLHAANALLLFLLLRGMTRVPWRSLFVAGLFGLHPLHVESVAWIAERKDVLSTTFWMLTLWAYARRAEKIRAHQAHATGWYVLALLFFAAGLMCKPMLVTLPCVLLLLDYWPLGRLAGASTRERWFLFLEKVPFGVLSVASSAVTLFAQKNGGTVGAAEDFPWQVRVSNALISYCEYLGKCFAPTRLAIFYPFFAQQPPLWRTISAGVILVAITAASAVFARRRPYLLVGWLWFLGTLVPVIGLVQVGGQSMADRYTYVPLIGVFIMVTWAAGDLAAPWEKGSRALGYAAAAILAALTILTSVQLRYWSDGAALFRHAISVTENNWVAHANLYATLSKESSPDAASELQQTMRILAAFAESYDRKGAELEQTPGHSVEAIKDYRTAIRIMPDLAGPHAVLGTALARTPGGLPEAIEEFRVAEKLEPSSTAAHYNLATALAATSSGKSEAVTEYETVTLLNPDDFQAHYNLAVLLSGTAGREAESIPEYEAVLRLKPGFYQAHFNLGLILARIPGRRDEAISQFEAVLIARPDLQQARRMIDRLRGAQP